MQLSFMIKRGQAPTYIRVINGPELRENDRIKLGDFKNSIVKKVVKKICVKRTNRKSEK